MIRKWFKINTCFVEILKNSTVAGNLEKKWSLEGCRQFLSCSSLYNNHPSGSTISSASTGNITKGIRSLHAFGDRNEMGDAESSHYDSDDSDTAVAETPAKTQLFEVKGPNGTAFLIEVKQNDLEEVKRELLGLKGDFFHFDKTIIEWFTMKCILAGRRVTSSQSDEERLAKVHAISSGSEEVYYGTGKYFFVNSLEKTMQAKRILERLGYDISGILYRFQAKEKVTLNERVQEVCRRFIEAVERLPKKRSRPMRFTLPEQIKNHVKPEHELIHIRGPGNSAFLVEMIPSKDVYEVRFLLKNFILIKHGCRYEEPGITQFERHGYVLTKPIEDFATMARKATVHVREIEAESVIEMKKTKQLKFLCSPSRIFVTAYKLTMAGYEVESSGIHYFPKYVVGLKKHDRLRCERFLRVMNELPNVVCIYDNIRRDLI